MFTYAARHLGLVGTNPVSLLDRVERPSSDDEKPKRILSAEELDRLLDAVEDAYRPLFALAAETGARLGEVLGLVWEDIDLDGQTVDVHPPARPRMAAATPKDEAEPSHARSHAAT